MTIQKSRHYDSFFRLHTIYDNNSRYLGTVRTVKIESHVHFLAFPPFSFPSLGEEQFPFYTLKGAIAFLTAASKINQTSDIMRSN